MSCVVVGFGAGSDLLWHARTDAGHHIISLHSLQLTPENIKEERPVLFPEGLNAVVQAVCSSVLLVIFTAGFGFPNGRPILPVVGLLFLLHLTAELRQRLGKAGCHIILSL